MKNKRNGFTMQIKNEIKDSGRHGLNLSALYVLIAGCLWGFMGILVRTLNEESLDSMEITFIRSVVTLAVMLAGLFAWNKKAFKIRIKDIWCFIGTGGLSVAFFNYCYFKTMTLTSLSVAAVLLYTAPAFVMLMSAFLFKETLSRKKLLALLLAFLGCTFVSGIVGGAGTLSAEGILYGLGAGFGYALYSIFGRYALEKNYSSATISFYTFVCSSVVTFFFVDAGKVIAVVSGDGVLLTKTILLVLLVTLLPYLSYTKGLNGMENGTAAVLASIEPVVATLVGMMIYKETLNLWNITGIILVLGSIILININKKK
ncbi:MAG: DMT family transporter [Lachnospiraceae bacterium]|nr:DMT family transporter [Lachnospiraceae bacterium]